jgi:hypothetical protein
MGSPLKLDEYEDKELLAELSRRANKRSHGVCDYCGFKFNSSPCRFPARHSPSLNDAEIRPDDSTERSEYCDGIPSEPAPKGAETPEIFHQWSKAFKKKMLSKYPELKAMVKKRRSTQ